MATSSSPADPLFYLHHSFIDLVYAAWQDCHNRFGAAGYSASSNFARDGFETVMPFSRLTRWQIRARPRDVDNIADMSAVTRTSGSPRYYYEISTFLARREWTATCGQWDNRFFRRVSSTRDLAPLDMTTLPLNLRSAGGANALVNSHIAFNSFTSDLSFSTELRRGETYTMADIVEQAFVMARGDVPDDNARLDLMVQIECLHLDAGENFDWTAWAAKNNMDEALFNGLFNECKEVRRALAASSADNAVPKSLAAASDAQTKLIFSVRREAEDALEKRLQIVAAARGATVNSPNNDAGIAKSPEQLDLEFEDFLADKLQASDLRAARQQQKLSSRNIALAKMNAPLRQDDTTLSVDSAEFSDDVPEEDLRVAAPKIDIKHPSA
ncbi:MAG: hypothetical protein MHM6MM_004430 [Cercozoa sp. M6MM]